MCGEEYRRQPAQPRGSPLCLWYNTQYTFPSLHDSLSALLPPVKPYLAKAPENVSTDAGSTVRFSCAVDGVPRPKVVHLLYFIYLTSTSAIIPNLYSHLSHPNQLTYGRWCG